jgi:hypothetical protein
MLLLTLYILTELFCYISLIKVLAFKQVGDCKTLVPSTHKTSCVSAELTPI